ncbi:bacterial transcriptional activator domain-containing protein [Sinosporangium album]|uniref:bacterial transcriptional activator domain-containing protein n=1 Tax=Sinosporangium album TaxID=504805 RepID=UPI001FE1574D|nr:bacterial transcriptional activator domain-containing protein [Sinosporangium album]
MGDSRAGDGRVADRGMRPGRPVSRTPVRIRPRRTAGDILIGIGALCVLALLIAGVPFALLRLAGPPISPELLSLDLLSSQVGMSTVIAILVLLVWLAWLQLVVCVIVEVYAGVRRVGMPARVPLSGGTQALANRLVSAALLLFTASAVVFPMVKANSGPPPSPSAIASALAAPVAEEDRDRPSLSPVKKAKKVYVVQPPHGRHHESLWEIADKCLGDGRRYGEIYRLNQHKEQPDGSKLQIADLIRPGWVLDMPDDAVNVHIVPSEQPRSATLDRHPGKPAELDGKTDYLTPGDARGGTTAQAEDATRVAGASGPASDSPSAASDGVRQAPGDADRTLNYQDYVVEYTEQRPTVDAGALAVQDNTGGDGANPGAEHHRHLSELQRVDREPAVQNAETAQTSQDERAGRVGQNDQTDQTESGGARLEPLDYLAGASLAAAGLLVVLGRRRREQMWHRAFGHRIARPREEAAEAETALRLGADAPGSRMLDVGLRVLGRELAAQGRTPPTIYAAHLSAASLDLWIHPPQQDAPEPWTAHDGGQVWRLAALDGRMLDERTAADAAAPYPGLVSIGTDGRGRVLVDLEAAQGLIGIHGPQTTAALAALAVELATNRWSDRMRLTLVGFGEELSAIAPERIRCVSSIGEALPEFEKRAVDILPDQVLTGRVHSRAADPAWPPHYLLSAVAPTEEEAARLAILARTGTRSATGYLIAGNLPHATWTWEITADGLTRIDALGFEVDAQLLPKRDYSALVELFKTARRLDGEPMPVVAAPDTPISIRAPEIEVRILGPIELEGVGPLEEGRLPLAQELVVYLSTHPGGVHPVVLGGVLWPRGVHADVRDSAIARVADWLSADGRGRPHLSTDESGRLKLGPEVRTDWSLFQELVRRSHSDAPARTNLLERALSLVRGPLMASRPKDRYAWLASDDLEYNVIAEVADAAHRLFEIRLAADQPVAAVAAVRAGLLLAADDEALWRDLLRGTYATGDAARLRAVADALHRRAASHPYGGGMSPETESLIDELLPSWRVTPFPSTSAAPPAREDAG